MVLLHRFTCITVLAALMIGLTSPAFAQEADADKAQTLLKQGIAQFDARNYQQAKAVLLSASELNALPAAEKKTLDEYLVRVDPAIKKQHAAMEAYRAGEKALKANQLAEAKKQFTIAASSTALREAEVKDAQAELAVVDFKIKKAAAADKAAVDKAAADKAAADKAVPVKAAPVKAAPVKAAPVKAAPVKAAPVKAAPVKAAPVKAAPVKAAPVKAAPVKAAPVKAAPQKPNLLANAAARKKKIAAEHLAKGKKLLDGGSAQEAVGELQTAASLDPNLAEAKTLLALAKKLSNSSSGGGGILGRLRNINDVRRGEVTMEYEKAMQRSKELMATAARESDFSAASESANAAANILETSKSLFTGDKYRQMQAAVKRQLVWVEENREKWVKKTADRERIEVAKASEDLIRQQHEKRMRRISDHTQRAKSLSASRKFAAALEELKQIKILDPDNRFANEHMELLQNFTQLEREKTLIKDVIRESNGALLDIRDSEIPWHQLVNYPRNWKEITLRRKPFNARAQSETKMDRVVKKQLDTRVPKLDFEDMELSQVFQFLRDVSGSNIHVKWRALARESVEPATTVNVHLTNVTFRKALDTILEDVATGGEPGVGETGLGYVINEGVITVSTKSDLGKQTVVRVYDIRDMIVRVPMFEGPRLGRSTKGAGDTSSDDAGLFDPGAGGGEAGKGLEGEMKSRGEIITEIKTLIADTVDRDSWRGAGGEAGAISEMGGQLVITQTIENHDSIVDLIGQLREARALEVNIEARFITVASGFLNRVGIDLDFYFNMGPKFLSPTTLTTPAGVNNPMGIIQNGQTAGTMDPSLPAFTNEIGAGGTGIASLLLGAGGAASNPAFSFGGQFLDDMQVTFLLEATQAHDMTRTLTAPRITLFNGQRAYISISTEETYVSGTESQVGDNSNAQDVETDEVTSGTVLDVEATVSADRRYVTMTIRPQVSTTDLTGSVNVEQDPTNNARNITLPTIVTQDLQTTVSVPDGGTLLLGGQKTSSTVERELGVPVLSKVPFLRRLFTNTGETRDEATLMIMVRPKIIIQSEKELEIDP